MLGAGLYDRNSSLLAYFLVRNCTKYLNDFSYSEAFLVEGY
jgi:hypothetical protein